MAKKKKYKLEAAPPDPPGTRHLVIYYNSQYRNPWRLLVDGEDCNIWSGATEEYVLQNAHYLKNCMYHHSQTKVVICYRIG